MLHPVVDRLFGTLLRRWHRYQDAPRDPGRVTELAAARIDLDDARLDIAEARDLHHPEAGRPERDEPRKISVDVDEYAALRVRGFFPEG